MRKFKVAVIGCGAVSVNHGKALLNSERTEIAYAADIDIRKAERFSEAYGGKPISDYRELFSSPPDAVHVVTPHHTHPEIAIECMEHGMNVFCEKPLAIKPADAKRMIGASDRTGKALGVCFQNRVNESSIEAKRIADSGVYGNIISAVILVAWDRHGKYYSESPWRGTYEKEGGSCVINQSIHTIDLLNFLSGGIKKVTAVDAHLRDTSDYETEDNAIALMELKNGASAVAFMSNCAVDSKISRLEIHFEKAVMTVEPSELKIAEKEGDTIVKKYDEAKGYKSEWGLSHGKLIDMFYASLTDGTPFICDARTGLATTLIVDAILHSKGRPMEIIDV